MMTKEPLVSIVIPAYKTTYLQQAITSAINQTYENIEIIVVNDKSPFDIREIVEKNGSNKIKYFENAENIGGKDLVAQWNHCVKFSKGEFICLLCDDDVYEPEYIDTLIGLAKQYPSCNVFRSGVVIINQKGDVCDYYPSSPESESVLEYIWHVSKQYRRQSISEFLIRRERFEACNGYFNTPLAWGADYISIYHFAKDGGIVSTNKRLVRFRQSGENISSSPKDKHILEKLRAWIIKHDETERIIRECNPNSIDLYLELNDNYIHEQRKGLLPGMNMNDFLCLLKHPNEYGVTRRMLFKAVYTRIVWGIESRLLGTRHDSK